MKTLIALLIFFSASMAFAVNESLLQDIIQKATASGSDSLVIVQDGKTIYESYFGSQDKPRNVQSITKSICGLAVAILIEEGRITSLDTPMSQWIPAFKDDPAKAKITLRMIMSHMSGYPDVDTVTDFFQQPDLVQAAIQTPLKSEPGAEFRYSSIASSLLQPVIAQASGKSVQAFIQERILSPLGINDASWKTDAVGQERTSGGISLSTADLLKIGEMTLNHGTYRDYQILRPENFETLITPSQSFKDYGLTWWLMRPAGLEAPAPFELFAAFGWGGQNLILYPAKKLIAIRTKNPETITDEQASVQEFSEFRKLIRQWE